MQRRSKPLSPALAPLTPNIPEQPTGVFSREELADQVINLKVQLAAERKRAARVSGALSRYIELLENVAADQRRAFVELHSPLVPSAAKVTR